MTKRLAFLFLLALLLPAVAEAKGPISVSVCGVDACSSASHQFVGRDPFGGAGVETVEAAPPGPYYRVKLDLGGGESWSIFYVPAARALAIPDERGWVAWRSLGGPAASIVRRFARDLKPFPRPTVSEALVSSRPLRGDPARYLGLLEVEARLDLPVGDSVLLELRSERASPWTNRSFRYYPDDDVLQRPGGAFVRLPAPLAADLEASYGAAPADGFDDAGFPWQWFALALACGSLLVAAAAFGVRRMAARRPRLA